MSRSTANEGMRGGGNSSDMSPLEEDAPPQLFREQNDDSQDFPNTVNFCQPVAAPIPKVMGNGVPIFCQPVSVDQQVQVTVDQQGNNFAGWPNEMNMAAQQVPSLREWVYSEAPPYHLNDSCLQPPLTAGLTRKLSLAFAIGKLLEHIKASVSSYSQDELLRLCSVDNFALHTLVDGACDAGWELIGVDMISPPMSLRVELNSSDSEGITAFVTRHSPSCCA
jgi:hypothetical protein